MAPDNMTAYVLWSGLPDDEDRLQAVLQHKCAALQPILWQRSVPGSPLQAALETCASCRAGLLRATLSRHLQMRWGCLEAHQRLWPQDGRAADADAGCAAQARAAPGVPAQPAHAGAAGRGGRLPAAGQGGAREGLAISSWSAAAAGTGGQPSSMCAARHQPGQVWGTLAACPRLEARPVKQLQRHWQQPGAHQALDRLQAVPECPAAAVGAAGGSCSSDVHRESVDCDCGSWPAWLAARAAPDAGHHTSQDQASLACCGLGPLRCTAQPHRVKISPLVHSVRCAASSVSGVAASSSWRGSLRVPVHCTGYCQQSRCLLPVRAAKVQLFRQQASSCSSSSLPATRALSQVGLPPHAWLHQRRPAAGPSLKAAAAAVPEVPAGAASAPAPEPSRLFGGVARFGGPPLWGAALAPSSLGALEPGLPAARASWPGRRVGPRCAACTQHLVVVCTADAGGARRMLAVWAAHGVWPHPGEAC